MKFSVAAVALAAGLSLGLAESALAFSTITIDSSGQNGSASFRDSNKLTSTSDTKTKQPGTSLYQSSDGKISLRANFQGSNSMSNSSNNAAMSVRNNFSDFIPGH